MPQETNKTEKPPRSRNLSRAELLVDLGRAPTVAAAWAQIRNEEREREWQQERRRRAAWEKVNARKNAADNARRRGNGGKNEVNSHRRYEFINRCFRVKAHIVRNAGVFTEKSREFYAAPRAAQLAVIGRIFAKRARRFFLSGISSATGAQFSKSGCSLFSL